MERNSQPTGLVNVIISLVAAAVGIYISRQTASVSDEVVSAFLGLGFLVTLFSYFQMRMEAREKLEKLELDELAKATRSTAPSCANLDSSNGFVPSAAPALTA